MCVCVCAAMLSEMRSERYLILCIKNYFIFLKAAIKIFSDKNWKFEMVEGDV